ncbi:MAG: Tat pathway signal protein [Armatimonadota bacterium]|nr:Tat pathway signal protein [Armatimonadota bacterium]
MSNSTIWANLLHLGYNMWSDRPVLEGEKGYVEHIGAMPYLRFDTRLWDELIHKMAEIGMNMLVIDLGEGVEYQSHPELAVKGSWSVDKLKGELAKLRELGIEPIPKLNFSACHDTWMGPYSRCVSTPAYYKVCSDLIAEVLDIFNCPRFFHLGMDEETYGNQTRYEYAVVRLHDLWWKDFYFLVEQVEKGGSRAWIWSDYLWQHKDTFGEKMPKSVLQSNWHYGNSFSMKLDWTKAFPYLESCGYDQIPTGSNWFHSSNFEKLVPFCTKHIAPERLLGFMTTPWRPTIMQFRDVHIQALEQLQRAKLKFERKR